MMTLQQILAAHPEWADVPVAIYAPTGDLHYVGESGLMYLSDEGGQPVLVFAGN